MALAPNGLLVLVCGGAVLAACGATPLDAVSLDPTPLSIGLVAHWTFDEGSGTTVGDHSGNGHDGVLTGGTWTSAGRFGGALQLAQGDYVTVTNFPQATANWTLSVWIQMSDAQLAADLSYADYATVLSTEIALAGGYQLQLDYRPSYQRLRAAYWEGPMTTGDYVVDNCQCLVPDRWIHFTAVFDDEAHQFTLYDGDAVADQMPMPAPIELGDSTLYMGKWNMDGRFLAADLDDFAVWSRALSAAEVAALSQRPPPD